MRATTTALALLTMALSGCAAEAGRTTDGDTSVPAQPLTISVAAFPSGGTIPRRHTCDGDDRVPLIFWSTPPAETRELAVLVDDSDADDFTHLVVTGLPAGARQLSRAAIARLGGLNDFGRRGWSGPCPPRGEEHQYLFHVYALDRPLGLGTTADGAALRATLAGAVLSEARTVGFYRRGRD